MSTAPPPGRYRWQDELGRDFLVAVDWKPLGTARCGGRERTRGCGVIVLWVTDEEKRKVPVNADGSLHRASCPMAASFSRAEEPPFHGL